MQINRLNIRNVSKNVAWTSLYLFISRYEATICSRTTSGPKRCYIKKGSQVELIGDSAYKIRAYGYLEQNETEESVIVSVCATMLLGITRDG